VGRWNSEEMSGTEYGNQSRDFCGWSRKQYENLSKTRTELMVWEISHTICTTWKEKECAVQGTPLFQA